MSRFAALILALSTLANPLSAMSCSEEIAALYRGGPIDPFARGSWRETTTLLGPDGVEKQVTMVMWQSPSRVMSISNGQHIIAIESDTWMASTPDGPWTSAGRTLPEDIEAFHKAHNDALMRNITEVNCPGTEIFDGREIRKYVFRSKTDPNEYNSWFGGLYTAYIDTETNRLVRMETSESIASWAPEKSADTFVTVLTYDDTIKVDPPE